MTSPEEPPQQPPPPQPQSPQAIETEEALAAAESSLAPLIAAVLIAAAAQQAVPDIGDLNRGLSGVLLRGALFTPAWAVRNAATALIDGTIGSLLLIMHPLVLWRLQAMRANAPAPPRFGEGPDLSQIAYDATVSVLEAAAAAMQRYADDPRSDGNDDIYDMFGERPGYDPRSAPQRRAEVFAHRTARWLVREAVFRSQELIARVLGYTHKRWLSERDNRVRTEHVYLDGKVVRIGGTFTTETGRLKYPGDISAPIHLWINCRCSLEWLRR